jgi:protein-S-isoprenylcysteine O-methyltransferase Ste14
VDERIFHSIFSVACLSMIGIRLLSWRAVGRAGDKIEFKENKLNMAVRAALGLGYVGSLLVYIVHPRFLAWATFPLPSWARWLGAVFAFASLLLLAWVHWALGKNFSTTLHVRQRHTLVTHGPYRWVRHPMYTALFLFGVGILLLTANWFVGGPLVVAQVTIVAVQVGREETMMMEQFGDEYRAYMQRTGRYLPRLTRGTAEGGDA